MVILDTNHIDVLMQDHPRRDILADRLKAYGGPIRTTIITVLESIEGWLKKVNDGSTSSADNVRYYRKLEDLVSFYTRWNVLPFDKCAAERYDQLRRRRGASRKMNDLKIAAIALCHGATVLTANTRDFDRISGLTVEDWLVDDPLDHSPV